VIGLAGPAGIQLSVSVLENDALGVPRMNHQDAILPTDRNSPRRQVGFFCENGAVIDFPVIIDMCPGSTKVHDLLW
jgi:hypothetical protein